MAKKRTVRAINKKKELEEKISKWQEEIKELEEKAERDLGRYIFKKWNIEDDMEKAFEVIDLLSDQANNLLKEGNKGGSEEQ